MKKILSYFIRGLVFVAPVGATILVVLWLFESVNESLNSTPFHGLSLVLFLVCVLLGIVLLGYFGSTLLFKPVGTLLERLLRRIPLVGFIYTSLKDVITALVGEDKKFDVPVLVQVSENSTLQKPGFITQDELKYFDLPEKVAVYMPHSYAFSGNVCIVERKYVTRIDVSGSDMMKFIVSGGVAGINKGKEKKEA